MSRPESVPNPEEDTAGAFRELRQYAIGNLDVDHHDVHPIAGLIEDDALRQVLGFMAETYDRGELAELINESRKKKRLEDLKDADRIDEDVERLPRRFEKKLDLVRPAELPATFWRTDFAERAIKKHATDTATRAIRDGNLSQVSYITGLPSYSADISGLHAINQLADWLVHSEDCKLVYLAALMGRGKTDFATTLYEIIDDHYRRLEQAQDLDQELPTVEFAANFEISTPYDEDDDPYVEHIDNFDDLLEWGEQGDSDDVRWFIFDEASTELTAQSGANAQDVAETMAPFVKKMRKLGINMIVIGHDRRDVHVAIRSLADFVDKTGKKTASFYAGIKKREPTGHLFDVSGIPPTSWDYDTNDMAEWSWGDALGEDGAEDEITEDDLREMRDERIARLYELTEISQSKLATAFGVSQSTVSGAVKRFDFETDTQRAVV